MDKNAFNNLKDFDIAAVGVTGGTVHVRTMRHGDAETYEKDWSNRTDKEDYRGLKAELLRITLCTEEGAFLFADTERDAALEVIRGKSRLAVDALFEAAQKVNGYDAKAAEDDAKN